MNRHLYRLGYAFGAVFLRPLARLARSCPDDLTAEAEAAGVLSDAAAADPVGDYRTADEGLDAARQAFADFDAAYANPDFRLWAKELRA